MHLSHKPKAGLLLLALVSIAGLPACSKAPQTQATASAPAAGEMPAADPAKTPAFDIKQLPVSQVTLGALMSSPRRGAGGQAMVLGLALLLVLCIGVIVLFDTGQTVNKKVQITNATDAAAYSVAAEQARALNFAAYANRGRVANEVTIAQLISVYSFLGQVHSTTYNLDWQLTALAAAIAGTVVGAPIAVVLEAVAKVMKAASVVIKGVKRAYRAVAAPLVLVVDKLNLALTTATETVIRAVGGTDAFLLAEKIVKANAPDAGIGTVSKGLLISQLARVQSQFLKEYRIPSGTGGTLDQRQGADRFRNVVMASRDGFTQDRGANLNLGIIKIGYWGGTDQVGYDRWAAMDTLGVRIPLPFPLKDVSWPVGWGGAQAVQRAQNQRFLPGFDNGRGWKSPYDDKTYKPYGDAASDLVLGNLAANDPDFMLDGGQTKNAYFTGYGGLRDYFDVAQGKATDPDARDQSSAGPIFTVSVDTAIANARTSAALPGVGGIAGSKMQMEDKALDNKLAAAASAQVYFNRPPQLGLFKRQDNKLESGNLFGPYWQARLVDVPVADKAVLLAGSGL